MKTLTIPPKPCDRFGNAPISRQTCMACGDLSYYLNYKKFANGRDAAIVRLVFTVAIVADLKQWGYGDRWCYHTLEAARAALEAWDGDGEPASWCRHPSTGRREANSYM